MADAHLDRRDEDGSTPLRVLIADDHAVIREGLTLMFAGEPEIEIVGTAVDGVDAVKKALELKPDIVLMDLNMPVINGEVAISQIREVEPAIRFAILSAHGHGEAVLRAINAGALGYISKSSSKDEILKVIRGVATGHTMVDASLTNNVVKQLSSSGTSTARLTPREIEILAQMTGGLTNKEIGSRLDITENTVKTSVARIFNKLGVNGRTEAVIEAIRRGLISLD